MKSSTPHKIRCVETGEVFNSIHEAARKYNRNYANLSVLLAHNTTGTWAGYHWEALDPPTLVTYYATDEKGNKKEFNRQTELAEFLEVSPYTIRYHLRKHTPIKGYKIERKVEKGTVESMVKHGSSKPRQIKCVETGEVFPSVHAAQKYNITDSNLCRVINHHLVDNTLAGYHWEAITPSVKVFYQLVPYEGEVINFSTLKGMAAYLEVTKEQLEYAMKNSYSIDGYHIVRWEEWE